MIGEKRFFQRITVNVPCQFFMIGKQGVCDFGGVISNISEDGVGLTVSELAFLDLIDEKLKVGDQLSFQGVDEYTSFKKEVTQIIEGKLDVLRIEKHPDYYYLGCEIRHPNVDLERYIMDRKFADFCKKNDFK